MATDFAQERRWKVAAAKKVEVAVGTDVAGGFPRSTLKAFC